MKKIIAALFSIILIAMLIEAVVFQQVDKRNAYRITNVLLSQVVDLIDSSNYSLAEFYDSVKEDYKIRAQSVSYILDSNPAAIYDIPALKKIASLLSIDEIHIFDKTGKIYSGSVPKYYGYSFESGPQMAYFKPMLSDKSLSMCQDVTPNTAEGSQMMYAITWNDKRDKMIQIGIKPERLLSVLKQSEISTVVSEIPFFAGTYYAVFNIENGSLVGSNIQNKDELDLRTFGFDRNLDSFYGIENFIRKIEGEQHFCSCEITGKYLICIARSIHANKSILSVSMMVMLIYLLLAGIIVSQQIIAKNMADAEKVSQYKVLAAVSRIYVSMHVIDLSDFSSVDFSTNAIVEHIRKTSRTTAEMLKNLISISVGENYREQVMEFTDLDTLKERMSGRTIITTDFVGIQGNWYRAGFIAVDLDAKAGVEKVVLVFRNINDEKTKEVDLIQKSTTDELTGLLNRHVYEEDLKELNVKSAPCYIAFDLNGLKNVNDTIGHEAGDEFIKSAAVLMTETFGNCGKIYRTGGDEFAAILNLDAVECKAKLAEFKTKAAAWKGKLIQNLSISIGFILPGEKEFNSVHELVKEADLRMYDEKEKYYQSSGIDRNDFQKIYTSLGILYTKILKINLTDDSYRIVKVNKDEQTEEKGFNSKISKWLSGFAVSGQVYQTYVENYLSMTDLSYLRNYFKSGNNRLSVFYKRQIDGVFKEVLMEIIPADDYSDDDQNCYLYVKDIANRKK